MQLILLRDTSAIIAAFRGERDEWPRMPADAYLVADSDGYVRIVGGSGPNFRFDADNVTIGQLAAFTASVPAVRDAIKTTMESYGVALKWWSDVRLERDNAERWT